MSIYTLTKLDELTKELNALTNVVRAHEQELLSIKQDWLQDHHDRIYALECKIEALEKKLEAAFSQPVPRVECYDTNNPLPSKKECCQEKKEGTMKVNYEQYLRDLGVSEEKIELCKPAIRELEEARRLLAEEFAKAEVGPPTHYEPAFGGTITFSQAELDRIPTAKAGYFDELLDAKLNMLKQTIKARLQSK